MPRRSAGQPDQQLIDALAAGLDRLMSTREGRRVLLALVICAALIAGGLYLYSRSHSSTVVVATGPTVRVATWNLHQFSPRPAIDLRRIAQIIQDNQFDVVAVQEVKREGQEIDALLNTLGPPWRGAIGPINDSKTHAGGNNERFAFVYNGSHVKEVGPAQNVPIPAAQEFDRVPYEDTFEAGSFRFTLVTVHLDYTRFEQRRAEAGRLADMTGALASGATGGGVIILGDFNEERHRPNLATFSAHGWRLLIHDATNLSSTEDFDNIITDQNASRAWARRSGVVNYDQIFGYIDHKSAMDAVSDHRPAWADFATGVSSGKP